MEYNRRKFNIIVVFTLCLICFVVVFSSVDFSSAEKIGVVDSTSAEPEEEYIEDEQEEGEESEEVNVKVPKFNTSWQCLLYSIDMLNKANYRIITTQTVVGEVYGISKVQTVNNSLYVCSDGIYTKLIGSGAKSLSEFAYGDGTAITTKRDGKISKYTYASYKATVGVNLGGLSYYIYRDEKTSTASVTDKSRPIDTYYTIQATLFQSALVDYLKVMDFNAGGGSNPEILSSSLTFKIDKKTARIKSITSSEVYKITQFGFRPTCTSTATSLFSYKDYAGSDVVNEIKSQLK